MKYLPLSAANNLIQWAQTLVTQLTQRDAGVDKTLSGLGTMSTQNANNVNITGGSISGTTLTNDMLTGSSSVVALAGTFNESATAQGIYAGYVNSPRVMFRDTSGSTWEVDNNAGTFRWFIPGFVGMSLKASGGITTFMVNNMPTYASDSAAGTGGLTQGMFYKTSAGQVMVKL